MIPLQNLPPGWRLEALGPSRERRDCSIRITTPEGHAITFVHKPFQFACEITRRLESELDAMQADAKPHAPTFRIARPEQLTARSRTDAVRGAAIEPDGTDMPRPPGVDHEPGWSDGIAGSLVEGTEPG